VIFHMIGEKKSEAEKQLDEVRTGCLLRAAPSVARRPSRIAAYPSRVSFSLSLSLSLVLPPRSSALPVAFLSPQGACEEEQVRVHQR
jgi:hypothetical protein